MRFRFYALALGVGPWKLGVELIPTRPVHTMTATELAQDAGIHAVPPRGFAGLLDFGADRCCVAEQRVDPALTVERRHRVDPHAVGLEQREPRTIAGPRRGRYARASVLL